MNSERIFRNILAALSPQHVLGALWNEMTDPVRNRAEAVRDPDGKIRVHRDITYIESERDARLDLYRAESDKLQPVVFYIHGGNFLSGDKKYRRGLCTWLAKTGACVVNVNYGMAPKYDFRESLDMLCRAADWVADHAAEYHMDPERVMVAADSAGAYYGLFLLEIATNGNLAYRLGIQPPKLKFAGALFQCGFYDLEMLIHLPVLGRPLGILTQGTMGAAKSSFDAHPDKELCSPVNFVNEEFPRKIFLSHAKHDYIAHGQTRKLKLMLDRAGVPYEEYCATSPIRRHLFMLQWSGGQCAENNRRVQNFVTRFVNGED